MCARVFVREDISGTTRTIFINFSCILLVVVALSSSGRVTKSQSKGAIFGVFFPTDNALYIIAFGTHAKNGRTDREAVLDEDSRGPINHGGADPPTGRGNFGVVVVRAIQKHWQSSVQPSSVRCKGTSRPASADRRARHQFQATGQPVSRKRRLVSK